MKQLWEILVPTQTNEGKKIQVPYHNEWDAFVEKITGGLTIQKPSRGVWISPTDEKFREEMIPVKIACTEEEMHSIADFTAKHYEQKAVIFYLISNDVRIIPYDENFKRT